MALCYLVARSATLSQVHQKFGSWHLSSCFRLHSLQFSRLVFTDCRARGLTSYVLHLISAVTTSHFDLYRQLHIGGGRVRYSILHSFEIFWAAGVQTCSGPAAHMCRRRALGKDFGMWTHGSHSRFITQTRVSVGFGENKAGAQGRMSTGRTLFRAAGSRFCAVFVSKPLQPRLFTDTVEVCGWICVTVVVTCSSRSHCSPESSLTRSKFA